jgi:hypothetical protein
MLRSAYKQCLAQDRLRHQGEIAEGINVECLVLPGWIGHRYPIGRRRICHAAVGRGHRRRAAERAVGIGGSVFGPAGREGLGLFHELAER